MNVKQLKKFLEIMPEDAKITSLAQMGSNAGGFAVKHVDLCEYSDKSGDPHLVFVPAGTHIPNHYNVISSVGFDGTIVERINS
jgi:hypothetical protein